MVDTSNLKLESISVKDLKAYQEVQRMFKEETERHRNMGIISDYTIEQFKELVFNCRGFDRPELIVGLAHEKHGQGYVSFKFDCDYYKRITLTILHKDFDNSYISFRVKDKLGKIPLKTNVDNLRSMINEFVNM